MMVRVCLSAASFVHLSDYLAAEDVTVKFNRASYISKGKERSHE